VTAVGRAHPRWPGCTITADGRVLDTEGREIHGWVVRGGARRVMLAGVDGRRRAASVAELVLEAHGYPRPHPDATVAHLDGDLGRCALENVRWGPPRARRERRERATPRRAAALRDLVEKHGKSLRLAASALGLSRSTAARLMGRARAAPALR
jgi:hypothetical protein